MKVVGLLADATSSQQSSDEIRREIDAVARESFIRGNDYTDAVRSGLESAVDGCLRDHVLSIQEESAIGRLISAFEVDLDEYPEIKEQMVKGAILRDLAEGLPPDRVSIEGSTPFLLAKDEKVIWLFQDCDYYELRRFSHYEGGSRGVSVRLAKGVYYRFGAFRGQKITTENFEITDHGIFAVTNKHVQFKGSKKGFRIRLNKLISCEMMDNGILFYKDGANPKPQGVTVNDPWFAANLISSLQ